MDTCKECNRHYFLDGVEAGHMRCIINDSSSGADMRKGMVGQCPEFKSMESSRSPGCSTAVVEQMREALEMVKSYFWEPLDGEPKAWTEGEVQDFVEAAIKASR